MSAPAYIHAYTAWNATTDTWMCRIRTATATSKVGCIVTASGATRSEAIREAVKAHRMMRDYFIL